jgi:hypothetical protein
MGWKFDLMEKAVRAVVANRRGEDDVPPRGLAEVEGALVRALAGQGWGSVDGGEAPNARLVGRPLAGPLRLVVQLIGDADDQGDRLDAMLGVDHPAAGRLLEQAAVGGDTLVECDLGGPSGLPVDLEFPLGAGAIDADGIAATIAAAVTRAAPGAERAFATVDAWLAEVERTSGGRGVWLVRAAVLATSGRVEEARVTLRDAEVGDPFERHSLDRLLAVLDGRPAPEGPLVRGPWLTPALAAGAGAVLAAAYDGAPMRIREVALVRDVTLTRRGEDAGVCDVRLGAAPVGTLAVDDGVHLRSDGSVTAQVRRVGEDYVLEVRPRRFRSPS